MMNDFITPVKFKINLIAKQKNCVKSFLRKKERRNSFTITRQTHMQQNINNIHKF